MPYGNAHREQYGVVVTDQKNLYEASIKTKGEAPKAIFDMLNQVAKTRGLTSLHLNCSDLQTDARDDLSTEEFSDFSR